MRYLNISLFTALILFSGCATAIQGGSMTYAYSAVKAGRYHDALAWLSEAEKHGVLTPDLDAEIGFLRARSYDGLQRTPEAIGGYKHVIATFPHRVYTFQAKERLKELEAKEPGQPLEATPDERPTGNPNPSSGAAHL